ncbi:hypothetical protein [Mucilaginibacter sp. L3T2-6]|uniref:hypothetical protein n=1 Tax=Mucilaginibacter sp. L3T2-6 TaxID=3062491 RepID=UPI002674D6DC|nr:hypothetical protein [Mucilaginibacter sp. L3T2-6]MDO3641961.1 hypothetical protein [Mucilaginibacter sp. L3T2-6]MDV6214361.1 hypothetical protein [Mucilaginibacter sp. L3T2-6]
MYIDRTLLTDYGFYHWNGYLIKDIGHARMFLGFYAGVGDKMSLLQFKVDDDTATEIQFGLNHPNNLTQLKALWKVLSGKPLSKVL